MSDLIYEEIKIERKAQDKQWGGPDADDKNNSAFCWLKYILAFADKARVHRLKGEYNWYRRRLLQIAALAVAAIEWHDRLAERVNDHS